MARSRTLNHMAIRMRNRTFRRPLTESLAIVQAINLLHRQLFDIGVQTFLEFGECPPSREELEGTQGGREVVDPTEATLWFANKEMRADKALSEHLGKNEKTKVVVKLSTKRQGQPTSGTSFTK
jgi:hypothetical protein